MSNDNSWLTVPAPTPPVADPGSAVPTDELANGPADPPAAPTLSTRSKVGIVATAVVVGAIGVVMIQGSSSASPAATDVPGFGGAPGTSQQGAPGGLRTGLQGTVDAVSSSSITVDGTTVKVTGTTQVIVNGAQGSLADVTKGATVFVHTEGSGSSAYAERIFVGGTPGRGAPPGQQQGGTGTGTTSST